MKSAILQYKIILFFIVLFEYRRIYDKEIFIPF